MPWGEGSGRLPPMRPVTGEELVRMAATARIHELTGADELEVEETAGAWHSFADLMTQVSGCSAEAAGFAEAAGCDPRTLAAMLNDAIAELRRCGARVLAGEAGGILFVAVVPAGSRRDLATLFAQR
jgi:hypothetical protein